MNFRLSTFLRLANIVNVLAASRTLPMHGWQLMLLNAVQYVPLFSLIPRFIISLRELYARDVEGRRSGAGGGIDTGFGLSSSSGTAILFADFEESEELELIQEHQDDSA